MDAELEKLQQTILLLQSRGTGTKIMLLPQGTWMDELPFERRYNEKIRHLCSAMSIPLLDFSRALPDEAFVDSTHLTVKGQERFRELIWGEITDHLTKLKHAEPVQSQ
jgi:hypothetical protein